MLEICYLETHFQTEKRLDVLRGAQRGVNPQDLLDVWEAMESVSDFYIVFS